MLMKKVTVIAMKKLKNKVVSIVMDIFLTIFIVFYIAYYKLKERYSHKIEYELDGTFYATENNLKAHKKIFEKY